MSKSSSFKLLSTLIPLLAFLAIPSAQAQDGQIQILCSNGFRSAMVKLLPDVEHATGHAVAVQYGPSANLKRTIDGGEPFDVAIMTPQVIDDLAKEGKVSAGTEVHLASSGIGLAIRAGAPKPDISSAQAIRQALLAAKSVGYVKVGAGTPAILEMLDRLGISQDITPKTVYQTGAEQSMKNLADGKLDLDFALISEILPASGVQLVGPVPPEFQRKIVMAAGIASASKNREAAGVLVRSLTSATAAAIIKSAGLDPIEKEK